MMNNSEFLLKTYRQYWFNSEFEIIGRIKEREFGYQTMEGIYVRHISVNSRNELKVLCMTEPIVGLYCSVSFYEFPKFPMEEKGWKGANMMFDIDAKDLNLPCRKDHTYDVCKTCGTTCINDKHAKKQISLPCKICMDASRDQTYMLLDILRNDLCANRIKVYFSGNEGYHIHVYDPKFLKMDRRERAEIADYVLFNGATGKNYMPYKYPNKITSTKQIQGIPNIENSGWRGKVAKTIYGEKPNIKTIKKIINDGEDVFTKVLKNSNLGVKIDAGVTTDTSRVFRMPLSINSKSGLIKTPVNNLDNFEPYIDSIFTNDDKIKIKANINGITNINNKSFGPYKNETVIVPRYFASYACSKKFGNIYKE